MNSLDSKLRILIRQKCQKQLIYLADRFMSNCPISRLIRLVASLQVVAYNQKEDSSSEMIEQISNDILCNGSKELSQIRFSLIRLNIFT